MTAPWDYEWAGRLDHLTIHSAALEGNHLGDPADRPLWVYVPPGYDDETDRRYPSVYVIQGYGGFISSWANRPAYANPYPEAADRVIAAGEAPPCILVFVDAWTAYGGSQFVDSPGTGNYHTYLCEDVVGFVDERYRTLPSARHRGIQGKSSGGFGAMITPMLRPDLFGGLITHAGDALYELLYLPEFAKVVKALRSYDGDIQKWWSDFQSRVAFSRKEDMELLLTLGCTACFSAADDGTPMLPFDQNSGRVIDELWDRWLEWDPVRMVPRYADALRGLRAVWIDGGRSDQFNLDLGAVAFRDALAGIGVTEQVHFELFEGTHDNVAWRYPIALAWMAKELSP
ncbi:MAG TPA: alpha/beta hydrolase-fold protein [Acidimicrobiales bacterium]|jgi:S-formylglutathione hydrolase FrmB|nr:alpha/beta hydrolase-fold protein [Acidimicrobiales bacterium]